MTDQASVLQRLILAAEAALVLRSPGDAEYLMLLGDDVAAWLLRPAPDGRVIHNYTMMLMTAVRDAAAVIAVHGASSAPAYFRVIGALLPDVRSDFGRAIELRRRPTP